MRKNIIIFAPHPDDETIGCGGTIAKKQSEGFNTIIVVMTDGRNLFREVLKIESDPSPDEVQEIRRRELLKAVKILGVSPNNVMPLDFEDGALEEYETEAEKRVIRILKKYSPVEVYFPFIREFHPDHRVTNRIVRKCIRKLGLKPLMYQYCTLHKYGRVGPLFEKLLGLLKKNEIKVDVSQFIELKEKALKEYRSQFSIISDKQLHPIEEGIERYLKKYEIFYVVA